MSAASRKLFIYVGTWSLLVVLAAVSLALSFASLGPFEMPVALAIAVAKAVLVAIFFMELLEEGFLTRLIVATLVVWLALLLGFMVLDVLTRADAGVRPPLPVAGLP